MNRRRAIILAAFLICVLLLALRALPALSQNGGLTDAAVNWWVFGNAGGPAEDEGVSLNGTLGQPVIGPSEAGTTHFGAGYWYGMVPGRHKIYLPMMKIEG
jgi:hypothetical protein